MPDPQLPPDKKVEKIRPAPSVNSGGDGTFLGHLSCALLVSGDLKNPLVLDASLSPTDAFRKLDQGWVRAAPVRAENSKSFLGTLDLHDACRYLVDLHEGSLFKRTESGKELVRKRRLSWIGEHPQIQASLAAGKGTIEDLARMRPFHTFRTSDTLQPVCSALGSGSNIVGVVDDDGKLLRVVTQGALIRVLEPLLKNITIPVKLVMSAPVICVKTSDPASKAFDTISRRGISGLAVLDEDGGVCNNISVSDIKVLISAQDDDNADVFLDLPVEEFLHVHRMAQVKKKQGEAKLAVSKCSEHETLSKAIHSLVRTGYHHCWVVGDVASKTPVGVLSLTDIFKILPTMDHRGNASIDKLADQGCSAMCSIS